jgi:hypothetical protein
MLTELHVISEISRDLVDGSALGRAMLTVLRPHILGFHHRGARDMHFEYEIGEGFLRKSRNGPSLAAARGRLAWSD